MNFTSLERNIKATATLKESESKDGEMEFSGAFYKDDYLQLSYRNKNLAT